MANMKRLAVAQKGRSFRGSAIKTVAAVGAVAAAAVLVEAALVPALAIGLAVTIGSRLFPARTARRRRPAGARAPLLQQKRGFEPPAMWPVSTAPLMKGLRLKEASLKTVSFRIIVTTLDFGFNYVILGELGTAAGLSTISIVAGPFFYFLHETGWTYLKPILIVASPVKRIAIHKVDYDLFGMRVSHAVAKTITYRLFATASEFATNYIVVRDVGTAAWLSSFGFFLGPFIYFAHERFWERLQDEGKSPSEPKLIAGPALRPSAI